MKDIYFLSETEAQRKKKIQLAAYMNMARTNASIILTDIAKKLSLVDTNGKNEVSPDDCDSTFFLQPDYVSNLLPEQQDEVKKRLIRHFPFLKAMVSQYEMFAENSNQIRYRKGGRGIDRNPDEITSNNSLEVVAKKLLQILSVLTIYRNMMTHLYCNANCISDNQFAYIKQTAKDLDQTFMVSRIVIKERFNLKNEFAFVCNDRIDNSDRKNVRPNTNSPHCLYRWNYTMSEMAVVFLTSLFIEKKYSTMMFAHIPEFYTLSGNKIISLEKERMLLRELYTCYSSKLPKKDFSPNYNNTILGLDMLEEISKCPNELFSLLSNGDKEKFDTEQAYIMDGMEEELKNSLSEEDKALYYDESNQCFKDKNKLYSSRSDEDKTRFFITERGLKRRFNDRFAELALKWFDIVEDNKPQRFEKLRFQVLYGKYHYIFEKAEGGYKNCADGERRLRWIDKKLTTFGRLNDIEDQRTNPNRGWSGIDIVRHIDGNYHANPQDKNPWITDINTQYVIENNNIGLKFTGDTSLPDYKQSNAKPDFWLSVYDLPGMVFYQYLYERLQKEGWTDLVKTEDIIWGYKEKYTSLFSDLENGTLKPSNRESLPKDLRSEFKSDYNYDLDWKNIPTKVKDFIYPLQNRIQPDNVKGDYSRTSFADYVKNLIIKELRKTEAKIKGFKILNEGDPKQKGRKPSLESDKTILPGKLADFLSEDIVYLLEYKDDEHPGNINPDTPTGLNYKAMQKRLATFANKLQYPIIKQMFKELYIVDSELDHSKSSHSELLECRHPFLGELLNNNYNNVIELYEDYLDKRKEHFENLQKEIDLRLSQHKQLKQIMFHQYKAKWAEKNDMYYSKLGKRYISQTLPNGTESPQPIDLPNGLFNDYIRDIIIDMLKAQKDLSEEAKRQLAFLEANKNQGGNTKENDNKINTTLLIEIYNKHVLNDGVQDYYAFNREYELFAEINKELKKFWKNGSGKQILKLCNKYKINIDSPKIEFGHNNKTGKFDRPTFSKLREYLDIFYKSNIKKEHQKSEREIQYKSHFKKLFNQYQLNEKVLNRYSVQDMLLFYISKDLLVKNLSKENGDYKLADITIDSDCGILSETINFNYEITGRDKKAKTIEWDNVKAKDYRRMFKILTDNRLLSLLPKITASTVKAELIEAEFERYDLNRLKIHEMIFNFEKRNKPNASNYESVLNERGYVEFEIFTEALKAILEGKPCGKMENDFKILSSIRNSFCHGDYNFRPSQSRIANPVLELPMISNSAVEAFDLSVKAINENIQ